MHQMTDFSCWWYSPSSRSPFIQIGMSEKMTLLEELKLCAAHWPEHLPAVAQLLNKAAAEIESLQKDSANAYDALSKAQQERDELRRQNAELRECLQYLNTCYRSQFNQHVELMVSKALAAQPKEAK